MNPEIAARRAVCGARGRAARSTSRGGVEREGPMWAAACDACRCMRPSSGSASGSGRTVRVGWGWLPQQMPLARLPSTKTALQRGMDSPSWSAASCLSRCSAST